MMAGMAHLIDPSDDELRAWARGLSEDDLRAFVELLEEATHTYTDVVRRLRPDADDEQVKRDAQRLRQEVARQTGRVPDPAIRRGLVAPRFSERQVEEMRSANVLAPKRRGPRKAAPVDD